MNANGFYAHLGTVFLFTSLHNLLNTLKPTPEEALTALDESEYSEAEFNEMMELYEETLETIKQGEIVVGTVRSIHDGIVVVDIGFKSEGAIPLSEFGDPPAIEEGDEIEVFLESIDEDQENIVLSMRERLRDAGQSEGKYENKMVGQFPQMPIRLGLLSVF